MLYQKECIKNFDGYFAVDAMERDISIFKRELAQRVKNREIISYTIDDVEEDCGWGYSCGIKGFLFSTKIYYTITYRKKLAITMLPQKVAKTCKQFFRQTRRRR